MIYFIQRRDTAIKIGTTESYRARMSQLKAEHGELKLLGLMEGGRDVERTLHRQFARERVSGEWFKSTPTLLDFIEQHTHLDIPHASFAPISKKVDADIGFVMKLLKKRYGLATESDALRQFLSEHDPDTLERAQKMAEIHNQIADDMEGK